MDPLTVVMSALQLADNEIVKDAYASLKALIVRKFGAQEAGLEKAIDRYPTNPDGYHATVKDALSDSGAAADAEVLAAAEALLKQADVARPGTSSAVVNTVIARESAQVNIAGGSQTVSNTNTRPG
jgi:hypothetical protein